MIGLRGLLLIVSVVLFVIAAVADVTDQGDWLSWGLAVMAAAFVVGELGIGPRFGSRRS
jgi:uncharacterized membrane protein SirB2